MQKTMTAVIAAIQSIKATGFGFAGDKITHGHLGIFEVPAQFNPNETEYLLVPLFEGTDFPLRRIVQDADGSYRCSSPHIAGEVSAAELSLAQAVEDFNGSNVNKGGKIVKVMEFGTKPVVEQLTPLLPEPCKKTVDAILLELALTDYKADHYIGAVINGETVVLLVMDRYGDRQEVEHVASLGDNLLCVSNESHYIALGNGALYAMQKEAEERPAIGAKRLAKNKEIIEACLKANGKLVDGHGNGDGFTRPTHVALFGKPGQRELVVALYEGKNFCINQIDLDLGEKVPTVTSTSVGGNLYHPEVEMADRIHTYSDFNGNTLWNLVALTK